VTDPERKLLLELADWRLHELAHQKAGVVQIRPAPEAINRLMRKIDAVREQPKHDRLGGSLEDLARCLARCLEALLELRGE
jgi:hypothetical protein